jgi:flagellin
MTLAVGGALSALAGYQTQPGAAQDAGQAQQSTPQSALAALLAELPDTGAAASASVTTGATSGSSVSATASAADALGQTNSIVDTAQAAAGTVVRLLHQLQQTAQSASQPGVATAARANLNAEFQSLSQQLSQTVSNASAGGVNLVDGSSLPSVQVTADGDGGKASLSAVDLSLGGPVISLSADASIATATGAASALSQLSSSLQSAGGALDTLSSQARLITAHANFVAQLGAIAGASAGSAPDSADGVRLQALQIQQALAGQSGSIANAAPQSVLSLFQGS